MLNLGTVRPGETIYIPFNTFDSNDPSGSVTISGLATTDIEVYKDGGTTQRASDSGYTLLDTDGIDFDSTTGIHGISIDLSDNTTANFYEAGSQYFVVIASITVDAATINFLAARFRIGYPGALLDTTIATLSTQTSFTLEDGSADNDAYNGWTAVVHDLASAVQVAVGYVSDYVGSTKTVTLAADPGIFTAAAGDNISLFPPPQIAAVTHTGAVIPTVSTLTGHTAQTGDSFARLGAPAGASVSADIATIDGNVDTINTATGEIGTAGAGLTDLGGMSTTMRAQVNAEVDTALDTAIPGSPTSGSINALVRGAVPRKNVALSNIEFLMVDATDFTTPETGLTVSGTRSIDGGAFAAVSGTIAEVANGIYQFDAAAADMNADIVTFRFTATGAADRFITIRTSG